MEKVKTVRDREEKTKRGAPEASQSKKPTAPVNNVMDDPFVIIEPGSVPPYETSEIFDEPLEQVNKSNKPASTNFNGLPGSGVLNDLNPLDDFAESVPSFSSSGVENRVESKSLLSEANAPSTRRASDKEPTEDPFFETANNVSPKLMSPKYKVNADSFDDIRITVSEVPLFTQPTSAPPPSRLPPPRLVQVAKADDGSHSAKNVKEKISQYSSFQHFSTSFQSPTTVSSSGKSTGVSSIDALEDFAMGRSCDPTDDPANVLSGEEEVDTAAAVKDAMDRAEAQFKYAREVRERASVRTGRSKEAGQQEKDEKASRYAQERELREKQERLDRERDQREREEKEREQNRLQIEELRARQAVERATWEVRERAVAEARANAERAAVEKATAEARANAQKAAVKKATAEARANAQKAAVKRATAEARERLERAAIQLAVNEARERMVKEAREKLERATAEAKERSNAVAKEKAAAVARAEAEVKLTAELAFAETATAEARERPSSSTRHTQQNNEIDLESFFGTRPSSAPRPNRISTVDSAFNSQFQNGLVPEGARWTPSGTSSNIVDDLTSFFGGASPSGEFQEIDVESDEKRRARLEREKRSRERAEKAIYENIERDCQAQREHAERIRISEMLDIEISRWSGGKEGNLRALLSTLQYVLWPECRWQLVSLTDLITAAAVKKVYRKAILCVHPDKVRQNGANLQQKYIAEKVLDLLKEAWNKFNSEELC